MTNHIPKIEKRKLMTSGNSVVLTVPREWMEENKLKAGDEVLMIANGNLVFSKMDSEMVKSLKEKLMSQMQIT